MAKDTVMKVLGSENVIAFPLAPAKAPPQSPLTGNNSSLARITVKALSQRYNMNINAIYEFIKNDPSFPYMNVGLKKKFMINPVEFEAWVKVRTAREKRLSHALPEMDDLIAAFRGGKKKDSGEVR